MVRVEPESHIDAVAAALLPYLATNALSSLYVSCDPANKPASDLLRSLVPEGADDIVKWEDAATFANTPWTKKPYNITRPEHRAGGEAPLAAQFLTLFFPLGHCKAMNQNDQGFVAVFKDSEKWLKVKEML